MSVDDNAAAKRTAGDERPFLTFRQEIARVSVRLSLQNWVTSLSIKGQVFSSTPLKNTKPFALLIAIFSPRRGGMNHSTLFFFHSIFTSSSFSCRPILHEEVIETLCRSTIGAICNNKSYSCGVSEYPVGLSWLLPITQEAGRIGATGKLAFRHKQYTGRNKNSMFQGWRRLTLEQRKAWTIIGSGLVVVGAAKVSFVSNIFSHLSQAQPSSSWIILSVAVQQSTWKTGYFCFSRNLLVTQADRRHKEAGEKLKESYEFADWSHREREKQLPQLTPEERRQMNNFLNM